MGVDKAVAFWQIWALFADSDYFSLTAKDADGVVWTMERILPTCNWRSEEDNPIITGDLSTLTMDRAAAGPASVRLHFFEDAELPLIIDAYKFSRGNYSFAIRKLESGFTIEVTSNSALPDGFAGHVQEALRFVLARSISWRSLCVSDGNRQTFRLASAVPPSGNARLYRRLGGGSRMLTSATVGTCFSSISSIY